MVLESLAWFMHGPKKLAWFMHGYECLFFLCQLQLFGGAEGGGLCIVGIIPQIDSKGSIRLVTGFLPWVGVLTLIIVENENWELFPT